MRRWDCYSLGLWGLDDCVWYWLMDEEGDRCVLMVIMYEMNLFPRLLEI